MQNHPASSHLSRTCGARRDAVNLIENSESLFGKWLRGSTGDSSAAFTSVNPPIESACRLRIGPLAGGSQSARELGKQNNRLGRALAGKHSKGFARFDVREHAPASWSAAVFCRFHIGQSTDRIR